MGFSPKNIESCKYCGEKDLRYGYLSGYSRLSGAPGFWKTKNQYIASFAGVVVLSYIHGLPILKNILRQFLKVHIKQSFLSWMFDNGSCFHYFAVYEFFWRRAYNTLPPRNRA